MHKKRELSIKEAAQLVNASVVGDENYIINDISEPETADKKSIVYLSKRKFTDRIICSKAKAVLVSSDISTDDLKGKILLKSENIEESFIKLLDLFKYKEDVDFTVSKKAVVHKDVEIEKNVHIDDYAVIMPNCKIAGGTVIYPSVYIGHNVAIGANCTVYPDVVIYSGTVIHNNVIIHSGTVIGSDGFGYFRKDKKNIKIPQIGNVVIEDDVEIGSNTSIDRATIGSTVIKKGVKIDDLVMIAHNVVVEENTIIASQTGISGSSKIGKNCILAGQVGVADHAVIEDNIIVGAKTGVPSRVVKSEEKMVSGVPAKPIMRAKMIEAIVSKLPEFYREFNELKDRIDKK